MPSCTTNRSLVVASTCLLAGLAAPCALAQHGGGHEDQIDHQFIISATAGVNVEQLVADANAAGFHATIRERFSEHDLYVIQLSDSDDDGLFESMFLEPRSGNEIEFFEIDRSFQRADGTTQSFFLREITAIPMEQYAVPMIGLPAALLQSTGRNTIVAVLDTGVSPHPLLAARLLPGFNFINLNTDASDTSWTPADPTVGHGTMVAGMIALVAPEASILPVKVLDSAAGGDTVSVAHGIYWAVDNGARIINLSCVTGTAPSAIINEAIAFAISRNVVVVTAAGNVTAAAPAPQGFAPATTPGVIAVSAIDGNSVAAPFTDFGPHVGLCAPGVNVLSTLSDGAFMHADGTSFAAPIVAGAAALVRARAPWLSAVEVKNILTSTAISIDPLNPGLAGQLGSGLLNTAGAINATPCIVDINRDGVANADDLGDFITAYFGGNPTPYIDFNHDGDINPDDLGDFITAFFDPGNGCG